MRSLAEKGHEVVLIAAFKEKEIPKGLKYRQIYLEGFYDDIQRNMPNLFETMSVSLINQHQILLNFGANLTRNTLDNPEVKKLLASDEQFDLVIVQQFHIEALKVLAWHYKAPLVLFNTLSGNSWSNHFFSVPYPPSYATDTYADFPAPLTFWQRLTNSIIRLYIEYYNNFLLNPLHQRILSEYFPKAPPLEEIQYNASLMLQNSDLAVNPAVPNVPNVINIGGFHINPKKELPGDLKKILDESKDGVVYFSMGSNLKSSKLPDRVRDMLLRAFSKVKQTVLWKWEDDKLPGQPKNVIIRKWMPQTEILEHPNVKLFISHGGLASTREAVYSGVPMLCIPVFADQKFNGKTLIRNGMALMIPYSELALGNELFEITLNELLTNASYQEKASELSQIFHDRPIKPLDEALFWLEYVMRHKGAKHLRVAGVQLTWYQYMLFDVIGFVVGGFASVLIVAVVLCKKMFTGNKKPAKTKKSKKH